jgi:uncharacterized membrane protein YqiK
MNELEQLRLQVAELREATRAVMAITACAIATASDSSDAAKRLAFGLAEAERSQPRSEAFQSLSTTVLHNLCTHAMTQYPGDLDLHQINLRTRPSPT